MKCNLDVVRSTISYLISYIDKQIRLALGLGLVYVYIVQQVYEWHSLGPNP